MKEAKEQLFLAQAKIGDLTKELEQKVAEIAKVEQTAYDLRKKETKAHLMSLIITVCRGFCLRTWTEALNVVVVDQCSELRNAERKCYTLQLSGLK